MKKRLLLPLFLWTAFAGAQVSSFSFNVNGTVPAGFTTALNIAGQKWSQYLQISVPVRVNVNTVNSQLLPFSAITIGNGRKDFSNAPVSNTLYPTALANQIAGVATNGTEFDMEIYFNLYTNYYYGTGKPPANQTDFISTAMHEIGHGLGFYSAGYVNGSGEGSFGNVPQSAIPLPITFAWHGQDGVPTIFDKYINKKSGNALVGLAPQNSTALGDSIENNSHYFSGPLYANASHSGTPVRLAGGAGTFTLGVDLLHIHDSYANTIMSYYWGQGDTVRIPGAWELGILREIGWNLKPIGVKENALNDLRFFYPNPARDKLLIGAQNLRCVKMFDVTGKLVYEENSVTEETIIDLRSLSRGLYFCRMEFLNGGFVSRELVVEK